MLKDLVALKVLVPVEEVLEREAAIVVLNHVVLKLPSEQWHPRILDLKGLSLVVQNLQML